MSSNFVKGFNVRVDDKKTVKIDANDRIARRLEELAEQMKVQEPEAIAEGFSEGLDADMVERLVSDTDEGEGEEVRPDNRGCKERGCSDRRGCQKKGLWRRLRTGTCRCRGRRAGEVREKSKGAGGKRAAGNTGV